MRTIGSPRVLAELGGRVRGLTPEAPRQWGKMNVHQMLHHVAGSMEWVLSGGDAAPWENRASRVIKFVAFRLPLPWPKGIPNPHDPASVEVPPEEFASHRARTLGGLEAMAGWKVSEQTPPHPAFGPLTTWEWHRWAFKHADHHLKQFGA